MRCGLKSMIFLKSPELSFFIFCFRSNHSSLLSFCVCLVAFFMFIFFFCRRESWVHQFSKNFLIFGRCCTIGFYFYYFLGNYTFSYYGHATKIEKKINQVVRDFVKKNTVVAIYIMSTLGDDDDDGDDSIKRFFHNSISSFEKVFSL